MSEPLAATVRELAHDLDLWAREAVRGNRWEPMQTRTLEVLKRVEEGLRQQGFRRKATEVHNLGQRLAGVTPDFTGATALTHELAKLTLHSTMDRAA
jgi:hypothetical protein